MFPLVARDAICRPKYEGGLGIRKNNDINKASIAKLGWRILPDNDSLWASIMRDKYVKNNNFFMIPKKLITLLRGKKLLIIENALELA